MTDHSASHEIVIVGAGLAGMTAAHELRDRDIVVVEARDRVGGRTLSGTHLDYWYNAGAQFVWDERTLDLCRRLGLGILDGRGARASLFLRGRLVRGLNPYTMFLKLPLSLRERLDLGLTITRLRRLAARMDKLDAAELDAGTLADLMGDVTPITRAVMDRVSEGGTGLASDEVSGWIGLGYAIHLFGGDVNETLKQVVGGTQAITKAIGEEIGSERVRLGTEVESVEPAGDGVTVRCRAHGETQELHARACVMATTADAVLNTLRDLPPAKRNALRRMVPYGPIISVAWMTRENDRMPWDNLLVTPVIGDLSFEQISNNAFFLQRTHRPQRRPGGCLVTLATAERAERLWNLDDGEIRALQADELSGIFPAAAPVIRETEARVARWRGFPQFRSGWLGDRDALREPAGATYFCGDYTAQPGTPGAVGSGYHVAQAVRRDLDRGAVGRSAPPTPAVRSPSAVRASSDEPRG